MKQEYWASVPTDQIAENITKKWKEYQSWLQSSNQAARIRKMYSLYYGLGSFGLQKDGSLSRINANLFKNTIDHIHILVTQNKLVHEVAGINTDSETLAQARVGKEYLTFIGQEKHADTHVSNALLHSLFLTECWLSLAWDSLSGTDVAADPDTGEVVRSGSQTFTLLDPFHVARDTKNPSACNWVITKRTVNRWDLAALHPKYADRILDVKKATTDQELNDFASMTKTKDDDGVDIFQLYHDITPSMKYGRQTTIVGDIVLEDSKLMYESIPILRMAPGDVLNSTSGTTPASDLVGLQDAFTKMLTAITSNAMNLSLTTIQGNGESIDMQKLGQGYHYIDNKGQLISKLDLGGSNPDSFSTLNLYQGLIDKISGVPDIARGIAPSANTPASAMALLLSQAIAFSSNIQRRYAQFAGDVGTVCIQNMKRFCKEEILLSITGKSQKAMVRKVKGDSFSKLDRVICMPSLPVSNTQQGRETIADKLLTAGKVDGRRYIEILQGAPVESIFEDEADELSLINSENEVLRDGGKVPIIRSDDHSYHRQRHLALLNSPIVRADPVLVNAVLAHVEEHESFMPEFQPPPEPMPDQPPQTEEPQQPLPDRLANVAPAGLPPGAPAEAQAALDSQQPPQ